MANVEWRLKFLEALAFHFHVLKSNHYPILVYIRGKTIKRKKECPFHFLAPWLLHKGFKAVVIKAWESEFNL